MKTDPVTDLRHRYQTLGDSSSEEEGEESEIADDSIAPVPLAEYESLCRSGGEISVGGIEIAEAQRRICARDAVDRRYERERIRQLHRERRLKRRRGRGDGKEEGGEGVVLAASGGDGRDSSGEAASEDEGLIDSVDDDEDAPVISTRQSVKKLARGCRGLKQDEGAGGRQLQLLEDEELAKHLLGM